MTRSYDLYLAEEQPTENHLAIGKRCPYFTDSFQSLFLSLKNKNFLIILLPSHTIFLVCVFLSMSNYWNKLYPESCSLFSISSFRITFIFDLQIWTCNLNRPRYIHTVSLEYLHKSGLTLRISPSSQQSLCHHLVNILLKYEISVNSDFFIFLRPQFCLVSRPINSI